MTSRALDVDRYLLAAAVFLTCALFLPAALDPVNVIKLTALLLVVIGLLVSAGFDAIRTRLVKVPTGPAAWVGLLLAVAFITSAVAAPLTTTAVLGAYGRNSGLLAYLGAMLLFFAAVRACEQRGGGVLVGGILGAALFTATYGLLQKAGIDAIPWNNPFNPIIAALGNPNFASGYLGVCASVATGGALWTGWSTFWRSVSGVAAALCLLAAALSTSVQGPIAAAAGLLVIAAAWVLGQSGRRRRVGSTVLGAATATGVALLLVGALAKKGPLAPIFTDAGSTARPSYWRAALEMFSDRPLLGRGLDHYGTFWREARSPESVARLGTDAYSDAAHSVPLQMLAQGGVVLGACYLAFVLITAWALVHGLLRLQGDQRMLLGALGAGWAAYQVQSLVSIDQVPLIVLHFALAGAVIAASGQSRLREVRLPGAPAPVAASAPGRKRRPVNVPPRMLSGADVTALGLVAVLGLVTAWFALGPLRANIAVKRGDALLAQGDGTTALAEYERAYDLVPGLSMHASRKARLFVQVEQPDRAARAYQQAFAADPYDVFVLKPAAELAESRGDIERSRDLFRRAAQVDPYNPETITAAATFELRHGGAAAALALLEPAARRLPTFPAIWATLGDARAVLDDPTGAREAYQRALALDAKQPVALDGLKKLAAAAK